MARHISRSILAGLGVVLAFLAGGTPAVVKAGGGCRGFDSTEATGTAVRMEGSCFVPTVLYAPAGSTITWTNNSTAPHNVAGATLEWGSYNELQNGETVQHRFDKAGTYPYYCFVHNGMVGAVVVGDGSAAATAADVAGGHPVVARVSDAPAEDRATDATAMATSEQGTAGWVFALLGTLGGLAAGGFVAGMWARRRYPGTGR